VQSCARRSVAVTAIVRVHGCETWSLALRGKRSNNRKTKGLGDDVYQAAEVTGETKRNYIN